jgi:hypothetical protein
MIRKIGAVVAGLIVWTVVVSILDRLLRAYWPEYATAFPTLRFTLPMMEARLTEGAVATIVAGTVTRWIAPRVWWPAVLQGVVLMVMFAFVHYQIWDKFPIWYHLTFLGSLVPLTLLGAGIAPTGRTTEA